MNRKTITNAIGNATDKVELKHIAWQVMMTLTNNNGPFNSRDLQDIAQSLAGRYDQFREDDED